jgi:hypothetical protein
MIGSSAFIKLEVWPSIAAGCELNINNTLKAWPNNNF